MSFDHTIKKGTTSKIVEVMLRDSTTGAGKTAVAHSAVTASYVREGSTRTAITLASGTAGDAYSSGKWAEVDSTNCKGLYQLHIPDAALATGVDAVTVQLQSSGAIDKTIRVSLLDVDLRPSDGYIDADVVAVSGDTTAADNLELACDNYSATRGLAGTALPAAAADAAGGLIVSDAGALDADIMFSNVSAILVDTGTDIPNSLTTITNNIGTPTTLGSGATISANLQDMSGGGTFVASTDSLEAIRDRGDAAWTTGAGGSPPDLLQSTTIATLASQTSFTLTAGSADNDAYNDAMMVVTDSATSTQKCVARIRDYVGATKTITLETNPNVFTMAVGDTVDIIAVSKHLAAIDAQTIQLTFDVDGNVYSDLYAINDTAFTASEVGTGMNHFFDEAAPTKRVNDVGTGSGPTASQIADAVWDEGISGHTTPGTFGNDWNDNFADIRTDTVNIYTDTQQLITDVGSNTTHLTQIKGTGWVAADNLAEIAEDVAGLNGEAMRGTDSAALATSVSALNDLSAAEVNAEVLDVLTTDTFAEPSSVPAATASLKDMIHWVYTLGRNKMTQTGTTSTLRNDADSGNIATSTVSDNGTTFTRGEYS